MHEPYLDTKLMPELPSFLEILFIWAAEPRTVGLYIRCIGAKLLALLKLSVGIWTQKMVQDFQA